MSVRVKEEDVKITRPDEKWSNGLWWHYFEVDGVEYRVAHKGWQSSDEVEESTLYRIEPDRGAGWEAVSAYNKDPFRHGQNFQGLLTPWVCTVIINLVANAHRAGWLEGYAANQADVREALGIK